MGRQRHYHCRCMGHTEPRGNYIGSSPAVGMAGSSHLKHLRCSRYADVGTGCRHLNQSSHSAGVDLDKLRQRLLSHNHWIPLCPRDLFAQQEDMCPLQAIGTDLLDVGNRCDPVFATFHTKKRQPRGKSGFVGVKMCLLDSEENRLTWSIARITHNPPMMPTSTQGKIVQSASP